MFLWVAGFGKIEKVLCAIRKAFIPDHINETFSVLRRNLGLMHPASPPARRGPAIALITSPMQNKIPCLLRA